MIILSHRGYWLEPAEKNALSAFRRSFDAGFGTETDIRDRAGELVIAHDPARPNDPTLADLLALPMDRSLPLALNIKADGLAGALARTMEGREGWFVFDMSIPDMLQHLRVGNPVFTRMSEVEPTPVLLDRSVGVWLDAFFGLWFSLETIERVLDQDKQVCLVSPELHGRSAAPLWDMLAASPLVRHPGLLLCTDDPEGARRMLGDQA